MVTDGPLLILAHSYLKRVENMLSFQLDGNFVDGYKNKEANFGFNGLGETTYLRSYSRLKDNGEKEQWYETVARVVNGCYSLQKEHILHRNLGWDEEKAQQSAQEMYDRMFNFKFLPPGRGLFAMGTAIVHEKGLSDSLFNCFGGNERFLTRDGLKTFKETVGTTQTVLTTAGKWVDAPILNYGWDDIYEITLSRRGDKKVIRTTKNHDWFVLKKNNASRKSIYSYNKKTTEELEEGDSLKYLFGQGLGNTDPSPSGISAGFAFGDGSKVSGGKNDNRVYLCGDKDKVMTKYYEQCGTYAKQEGILTYKNIPNHYFEYPSLTETKSYLMGWLAGYFAADGSVSKRGQVTISSAKRENLEFVKELCQVIGIGTYSITKTERVSNLTNKEHTMYKLTMMLQTVPDNFFLIDEHRERASLHRDGRNFFFWNVESVEKTNQTERVYCAYVEDTHAFVLEDNILTGNCSFRSTEDIDVSPTAAFEFVADFSMLGVGCGFDTRGAGKVTIHQPLPNEGNVYVVPDSREGWVESIARQLRSYFISGQEDVKFDYSQIRAKGEPIKTFGGVAPGPGPLIKLHDQIREQFAGRVGEKITSRDIVDLMNKIGVCVVSGNIRRSALISLGEITDTDYLSLKDYEKNPERMEWGWSSNNSIIVDVGESYDAAVENTVKNGEPGYFWLENAHNYGRLIDGPDNSDINTKGTNPCAEIILESSELCNLTETFPANHSDLEDYLRTLKFAYLYAKTVALTPSHWPETNQVKLRNLRLGISMSGVVQAINKFGLEGLRQFCDNGYDTLKYYDEVYSRWLAVQESIRLTTVKPSGSVSLLAGATPGIHWPISRYYIRRIRIASSSPIVDGLRARGINIIPAPEDPDNTVCAEFPVDSGVDENDSDVSVWRKVELAAFMQTWWSDNSVSCTITFDPEREGGEIKNILDHYQYRLKTVSFLPTRNASYDAMPYESITEAEYNALVSELDSVSLEDDSDGKDEKYCDTDHCAL